MSPTPEQVNLNSSKSNGRIPGPSLLGMSKDLPKIAGNRLGWMEDLHARYGDIVRLPFGPRTNYGIFHPDLARQVLVANAKKYWKGRTFAKTSAYLGNGLATSEGKDWQVQRRRMNPTFMRKSLNILSQTMIDHIDELIERWAIKAQRKETLDLSIELPRLAMEIVTKSLFGAHINEEEVEKLIDSMRVALEFTTRRTLNPFDIPESWPTRWNIKYKKAVATLDEIIYRVIEQEKAQETPSPTLLSLLLHAEDPETGERMDESRLRDEAMTMFLGGTDTSGNTMNWVFYVLGRYPEIRKKVENEVTQVLGDRHATPDDYEGFGYLRQVIQETLRLYPQNWVMSRDTLEEDELAGHVIPKDTTVFIGTYVIHRRPDFWEDPLRFDPNRFLPENMKGRHPLSYFPFGAGPRKCVGFNFAMMEFSFAIPMILQRFDIEVLNVNEIQPYPSWSLWPKPNIRVRLHDRRGLTH